MKKSSGVVAVLICFVITSCTLNEVFDTIFPKMRGSASITIHGGVALDLVTSGILEVGSLETNPSCPYYETIQTPGYADPHLIIYTESEITAGEHYSSDDGNGYGIILSLEDGAIFSSDYDDTKVLFDIIVSGSEIAGSFLGKLYDYGTGAIYVTGSFVATTERTNTPPTLAPPPIPYPTTGSVQVTTLEQGSWKLYREGVAEPVMEADSKNARFNYVEEGFYHLVFTFSFSGTERASPSFEVEASMEAIIEMVKPFGEPPIWSFTFGPDTTLIPPADTN